MLKYTLEIPSVNPPPIKLNMCDSITCPICKINLSDELNINLETFEVDNNTMIFCQGCGLQINFKIIKS